MFEKVKFQSTVEKLKRLLSNPFVTTMGWGISIILALALFQASIQKRELCYVVSPARSIIVRSGQASNLDVTMNGKAIKTDVTSAQIAFWNRGKQPIRQGIQCDDVRSDFKIKVADNRKILDSDIIKKSRPIVSLSIDDSGKEKGELAVKWDILEKNDGGVIQLIYEGGPEVEIFAEGIIVGQKKLKNLGFRDKDTIFIQFMQYLLIFMFLHFARTFLKYNTVIECEDEENKQKLLLEAKNNIFRIKVYIFLIILLFIIIFVFYGYKFQSNTVPPFGF
jgi:hypothetical protein